LKASATECRLWILTA